MKKCMKCGGAMKKMQKGGQTIVGMPGYNATTRPMQMKKGGIKKYQPGGPVTDTKTASDRIEEYRKQGMSLDDAYKAVRKPDPTKAKNGGVYKKGGSVKNAKLAAMAPPTNKITRADIITAAKRKAKTKKK